MSRNRRQKAPLECVLDITDLSHDGRGVARHEGKAVFVTGALPGERVRADVRVSRKQFDEGRVLEVLQPSVDRVVPRCAHFGVCGGCALQHLSPEAQIAAKQHTLSENFERIGQVRPERWLEPLVGEPWGYRRKARLGVKFVPKKGKVVVGFRESIDPRFIADVSRCEVLVEHVGARFGAIAELVDSLDARAQIPQIEVAAGDDRTALVFRNLQPLSESDREKLTAFGRREGFAIFLQPGGNDTVTPIDGGSPELMFALPAYGVDYAFRPLDFIQVNGDMNQRMLDHALALLDPQPHERVLDLFCGLGNFTLPLARRAARVVGVEGETGLVQRARENAQRNGIANVEFHAADLTADLRSQPWVREGFDALLLDPPRTGADATIPQLPLEQIGRIVYVSCHPGSLARDAGILVREHGYTLVAAGVMDMFPHTAHVESIALFEKH
ncbi:23S rRNA (uracil(1939)-C(5))-methyltransferase RlmD [Xanthomonadaceae bacterium JHOS43]|nr:23S rRNA (uracil(1939)-C(5))-methyltransferase RlmD [Xanthomonadaceae bacterium JHOS43]